ncbi:hypothetical protein MRX96_030413 [Rhipicephalus microplus]
MMNGRQPSSCAHRTCHRVSFSQCSPAYADVLAALVVGGVVSTGLVHLCLTARPFGGPSVDREASGSTVELVNGVRLLDYQQYLRDHVATAKWLGGGFTRLGCPQVEWTPFPRRPIAQTNSEDDCLYLNVWQPLLEEDGGTECGVCGRPPLLPAVVVLHGGRFQYGGGGAFGFLNAALQHDEAPGNVGIRDQIVALQWVHDNIHLFGASPFQVTLVGHEAGAASVGYHLLSNRSAAYFQRAVMMAGSPYSPYPENSGKAADRNVRALARELRCPDSSARRAAIECLKSRSVRATLEAADGAGIEFGPSYLSPQTAVAPEHKMLENAVVPEKNPNMRARFRPPGFHRGLHQQ